MTPTSQGPKETRHDLELGIQDAPRIVDCGDRDPGQPLGGGLFGAVEDRENMRPVSPTLLATMAPSERSISGGSGSGLSSHMAPQSPQQEALAAPLPARAECEG